jgi:tripartite ATP-independent transporter DctM subunit
MISVRRGYEGASARAPVSRIWKTFVDAMPALVIVVIVLGCIRFGITTATEAGVMALVWAFVLGKFVFRAFGWRKLYHSFVSCSMDTALIGFLIAASVPFAWVLIAEGIPQQFVELAKTSASGPVGLLVILNGVLLLAGLFLDLTPAMLIVVPLFLPIMVAAGIDPIHLGIIMIINLQLGGVTPPVGILVFISAQIARVQPQAVFKQVMPFFLTVIGVLALICTFPSLSLGLWDLFK